MNDPTGRALQLLSLLQTHRSWSGAELADRLEVSERTLRRDVDRLRALGYPVDATTGVAGGYRLAAGSHMPPLLLDDDEAVAIAVGLRSAASASIAGMEDTSVRALAKLEQVLPDRLRRQVNAMHANVTPLLWGDAGPTVDAEHLGLLAQACRDHEQVRFEYQRKDGEQARRLVEPHQLVSAGRRWYLVAWDVRRDDWRTFRVDRLDEPALAGVRFAERPIPGGDAAAYVQQSIDARPLPFTASVVVQAGPEEIRHALHWVEADLHDLGDGAWRISFRAENEEQLKASIAMAAVAFDLEQLEPPEVAALMHTVGRRLDRH